MIINRTRTVPAVVLLLAVAGCSFQGSVTAAGTSAPSSAHRSGATHSSSSAPASSGGTVGTTSSSPAAGSSTGSEGARVDRCHTGELTGSLVPGSPGAGQRYATVVLTNTGGRTCTVHGYGGIGLVDASGSPLPTHQVRVPSPAPTTVTVAPHGTVRSQLHWSAVRGTGDATTGPCQPTPAALQVIPPDETDHLSIAWNQGPVCEGGTIQQQAYAG